MSEHAAPDRIDSVAVRLCRVARVLADDRPAWIAIERLYERLCREDSPAATLSVVEAAVAFAGAKEWLSIGPGPADSILLRQGAP